jgi:hypothetical protein
MLGVRIPLGIAGLQDCRIAGLQDCRIAGLQDRKRRMGDKHWVVVYSRSRFVHLKGYFISMQITR